MKHVNLAAIERAELLKEEARARARAEDQWIEDGRAETVRLASLRGETIEGPTMRRGERRKPMRRKTGLEWLAAKGRLTRTQREAGDRYGVDYRIAEEVSIRSALNDSVVGYSEGPTEFVGAAKVRLGNARQHALHDHPALVSVCNAVCGMGFTLREFAGERRDADVAETRLLVALDLLATHYGMTR
jgi:hypothetical protein